LKSLLQNPNQAQKFHNVIKYIQYLVFSVICFTFISFTTTRILAGESENPNYSVYDTASINIINEKALDLHRKKPDSAFLLAHDALYQSEKINYQEGIADSYKALAYFHLLNFTRNDSANHYFKLAFDIYQKLENYKGMGSVSYGLGYLYSFKGNLTESEKYLQKGLMYFSKIHNKTGIYNSYHALSYIYKQNKEYEKAEEYINKAIVYAKQTKDLSAQANFYNSKGNIYKDQALFEHAIDIYFEALKLWEEAGDSAGTAIAHGSIGNMYYYQKDYKKALEYLFKKLPISVKRNDYWEVSKTYNTIALVCNDQGKYDSSLIYMKKSLQLNLMMNFPSGIADAYNNLASTYYLMSITDSAVYYADKSIIIARNIYDQPKLATFYILRGKIYLKSGNEQKALKDLKRGYAIAKKLEMPFEISDASKLLSSIYSGNGHYKEAFNMLSEHNIMQDSLNKAENIRKITQLELQYEFDKKQRKIENKIKQERLANEAKMQQQRIYIFGLSIVLVFFVLFGILIFRQKTLQAKFKTIELGQKLLRTQMNPHFIFNSLCAIQDYMFSNSAKEAGNFLSRFAALMRQILENSRTEYITVENEISMLNNYLEIQKLRFEKKFTYQIDIDEAIDKETFGIPPMLAQPFIENAIEHGLIPKKEAGKILIHLYLQNGLISYEIEDNGVGRKEAMKTKEDQKVARESLATTLTRERLAYLKKQTGKNSFFQIVDLLENNEPAGTRVTFSIPYQKIYS